MSNEDLQWATVKTFIEDEGIVKHIQDSYSDFITRLVPETVNSSNDLVTTVTTDQETVLEVRVKVRNPMLHKPIYQETDGTLSFITPHVCRLRKLNYNGIMDVDCHVTITQNDKNGLKTTVFENDEKVILGKILVMTQSQWCYVDKSSKIKYKECEKDCGGYFLTNGSEKIIIGQERMTNNQMYIFSNKTDGLKIEIKSGDVTKKLLTSFSMTHGYSTKKINKIIKATIQFVKKEIRLVILFRALGLLDDELITEMICGDDVQLREEFLPTLQDVEMKTREEALTYIGNCAVQSITESKTAENGLNILNRTFLPHLGDNLLKKAFFLTVMVRKLLETSLGRRDFDDRDHYGNKRVDMVGELFHLIFQRSFEKQMKEWGTELGRIAKKKLSNSQIPPTLSVSSIANSEIITKDLNYSVSTGNWGNTKTGASKSGVSQVASRLNLISFISQLRRLTTPSGKNSTTSKPRQLHNTQWGIICSHETPEGQNCGFLKNLAFIAHVSRGFQLDTIRNIIEGEVIPYDEFIDEVLKGNIKINKDEDSGTIYVNGNPIGYTEGLNETYYKFIDLRRNGCLPPDCTIYYDSDYKSINIWVDSGRCSVPRFIVKDNRLVIPMSEIKKMQSKETRWSDLFDKEYVEYIDSKEAENCLVAISPEALDAARNLEDDDPLKEIYNYTHCEIHPALILSVTGAVSCPYPGHQPAPRTTYQIGMSKQEIGIPGNNYQCRMDSNSHMLWYPQVPICRTKQYDMLEMGDLPTETNLVVAIMSFSDNQEDGIIFKQSAIDRGACRSTYFKTYVDSESKSNNNTFEENFSKSNDKKSYRLDKDGLICPGTKLVEGDRIIEKVVTTLDPNNKKKNNTTDVHHIENAIVDKTMLTTTDKGQKMVKTGLRITKIPEIGDKFASRYAQKGTVCMMYRDEDMPFNKDGISPDIIITPLAIPSRGTMGHLFEAKVSKLSALTGIYFDATLFNNFDEETISNKLLENGYIGSGKEVLTSGITGKRLLVTTFMGINSYGKLKHMVSEKIQHRARGPVAVLTRQPNEGRSRDGGLRFGEMETGNAQAQGCAAFVRERTFTVSDKYEISVCDICHTIATENQKTGNVYCKSCKTESGTSRIRIPYATKLLIQELEGMSILVKIHTKENGEYIVKV
jgi:DNA-directed RNA polymerase II subunit RPB2